MNQSDADFDAGFGHSQTHSRRGVLAGLASVGVAATLGEAGKAVTLPPHGVIDVHAHYMPPELKAAIGATGPMGQWTLPGHLDEMEKAGVARSLLSITTPGITASGDRGRALVRVANEYGAKVSADHSRQLGFLTYVQMEDPDTALAEIAYGFDTLKANGVGLFTSYNNKWLGDPTFDPVFAELERRKATVCVHPTASPCCTRLLAPIADTAVEYGTDTTRAIASYIYRGAARRYPNVTMIWSHSGGTMPFLIERFDFIDRGGQMRANAPDGFRAAASRFYYDVAQASNPVATMALRQVVGPRQIVFGTDYPFRTLGEHVQALETGRVFNGDELMAVYNGNVQRGLPQLLVSS